MNKPLIKLDNAVTFPITSQDLGAVHGEPDRSHLSGVPTLTTRYPYLGGGMQVKQVALALAAGEAKIRYRR